MKLYIPNMFKICCVLALKWQNVIGIKVLSHRQKVPVAESYDNLTVCKKQKSVTISFTEIHLHQLLLPADRKGHCPLVTIYLLLSPDSNSVINQWNTLHSPPPQLIGQWNGLPGHLFFDGAHFLYLRASCNSDSQHCQQPVASPAVGRRPRGRGRLLELAEHIWRLQARY